MTAGRNARIGETRPTPEALRGECALQRRHSGVWPRAAPAFAPKDESLRTGTEKRFRRRAVFGSCGKTAAVPEDVSGDGRRKRRSSALPVSVPHRKDSPLEWRMPYRTPTPVGRLNKPRRMGEHHRRNSANSPRALGPRGVPKSGGEGGGFVFGPFSRGRECRGNGVVPEFRSDLRCRCWGRGVLSSFPRRAGRAPLAVLHRVCGRPFAAVLHRPCARPREEVAQPDPAVFLPPEGRSSVAGVA